MSSLADKLAALTNPVPQFGDLDEEEDEDLVTGAKVTIGDIDAEDDLEERSYLRTVTAGGLADDERYKGKKFTRKELEKDRDFMEHKDAELGHMFDIGDDYDDEEETSNDDMESGGENTDDSGEEDLESEGDMDEGANSDNERDEDQISSSNNVNLGEETDASMIDGAILKVEETDSSYFKGIAVVNQLATWDKLLEQRILLQKMLTKVNTFPLDLDEFMEPEDKEHSDLVKRASKSLSKLVQKSVQLKNAIERKGVQEYEVVGDDTEKWLEDTAKSAENGRREIIMKWSDRTQRVGTMSNMNTPALEQIDQIMNNVPRMVKRTRVKRVDCTILGGKKVGGEKNYFDDSDFYHHLLRELIEKKTAASTDSAEVGRQWLQIQKLRAKLKKKVDTRASKGRKVRYDIHTKLVNFMAPISQPNQMNDSAKNELFSSLFGARKTTTA